MKNCILITNVYPYLKGEVFLQNELPYLSKEYDNIYIFSVYGNVRMEEKRDIPLNAKAFPLGLESKKYKYVEYTVKGLKCKTNELKKIPLSAKRALASIYVRGKAEEISRQILSLIDTEKIDCQDILIYAFWFTYQAIAAWIIRDFLTKSGGHAKAISRAHGYDVYWERTAANYHPYQDLSLKMVDKMFPCSEDGKQYLLNKFPWAADQICVSRLGTRDYGLGEYSGEKSLVTCCVFHSLKRMPLFAKAFCIIAKYDLSYKWICIGDGEELEEVKRIVLCESMEEQVEFMGRMTSDEVYDLYKTQGVMYFCNISTTEGLPVSIMEAFSFGIPAIATNVGGTNELVNDNNGTLISSDLTADQLAEILVANINISEKRYAEKRINARNTWEKLCSAEKNYTEFLDRINQI